MQSLADIISFNSSEVEVMKVRMIDDLIYIWNYLFEKVYMFFSAIYYFFFPTQLPAEFSAATPVSTCCTLISHDMKHQPTLKGYNSDAIRSLQASMWSCMKFPQFNRAEVKLASQYYTGIKHRGSSHISLSNLNITELSPFPMLTIS